MPSAEAFIVARILHVLGVVIWIGSVAFVTTVVLPTIRSIPDAQKQLVLFESIESRFAWQARAVTLITGLSGFYMLYSLDAWDRFLDASFWWVHLMTFVWLVFTLVLFIFEPLFLHRWFHEAAQENPGRSFRILQRLHWILLTLSLIAIVGGVAGTRGFLRF